MPRRHNESGSRLYSIWKNMRRRCSNPHCAYYHSYGGRGISVCAEWHKYENFRDWALTHGYKDGLTIDRIDNDRNYAPDNCRWATMKQQSNNTRTNRVIAHNGESHTLTEWSDIVGIRFATLWDRLDNGWSIERALTEPVHNNGRRPNCGADMRKEAHNGC